MLLHQIVQQKNIKRTFQSQKQPPPEMFLKISQNWQEKTPRPEQHQWEVSTFRAMQSLDSTEAMNVLSANPEATAQRRSVKKVS